MSLEYEPVRYYGDGPDGMPEEWLLDVEFEEPPEAPGPEHRWYSVQPSLGCASYAIWAATGEQAANLAAELQGKPLNPLYYVEPFNAEHTAQLGEPDEQTTGFQVIPYTPIRMPDGDDMNPEQRAALEAYRTRNMQHGNNQNVGRYGEVVKLGWVEGVSVSAREMSSYLLDHDHLVSRSSQDKAA